MSDKNYYFKLDKRTLPTIFNGDLASWAWYYSLKDYTKRFRADKYGYIRISNQIIMRDFGFDRFRAYKLNKKLESLGLIEIDSIKRGKRIPTGIKITKVL